ncbi:hypothetical protein ACVW16_001535 [Bradyrhizobium sp. USDA 4474]
METTRIKVSRCSNWAARRRDDLPKWRLGEQRGQQKQHERQCCRKPCEQTRVAVVGEHDDPEEAQDHRVEIEPGEIAEAEARNGEQQRYHGEGECDGDRDPETLVAEMDVGLDGRDLDQRQAGDGAVQQQQDRQCTLRIQPGSDISCEAGHCLHGRRRAAVMGVASRLRRFQAHA